MALSWIYVAVKIAFYHIEVNSSSQTSYSQIFLAAAWTTSIDANVLIADSAFDRVWVYTDIPLPTLSI